LEDLEQWREFFFIILGMQLAYLIERFESIQIDNSRNKNLMLFFFFFPVLQVLLFLLWPFHGQSTNT
jgi:hypothetical protein